MMNQRNQLTFEVEPGVGVTERDFVECLRQIVLEMPYVQISKEDVPFVKVSTEDEYDNVCIRLKQLLAQRSIL